MTALAAAGGLDQWNVRSDSSPTYTGLVLIVLGARIMHGPGTRCVMALPTILLDPTALARSQTQPQLKPFGCES